MNLLPFIKRDHEDLPPFVGLTIFYLDGKSEEYEVAGWPVVEGCLRLMTKDDMYHHIPLSAIKRISFDKRYSKMVAIKSKMAQEENAPSL